MTHRQLRSKLFPLVCICVLAAASLASASTRIMLSSQPDQYVELGELTGFVSVYVVVTSSPGVTGVRLTAPLPECLAGALLLSESSPFANIIGDSQTGATVDFGECLTANAFGGIHVLTMSLFVPAPQQFESCCRFATQPHPSAASGSVEWRDCMGSWQTALPSSEIVSPWLPPEIIDRQPPNAATNVGLTAALSWQVSFCSQGLGVYWANVYFGTSPDPPLVWVNTGQFSVSPVLQPGTTYYWRLEVADTDAGGTLGPVWSFTTETSLATKVSTWGRIKATYR